MKQTTITHVVKIQGSSSTGIGHYWEAEYELVLPLNSYTTHQLWELADAEWAKDPMSKNPDFGPSTCFSTTEGVIA